MQLEILTFLQSMRTPLLDSVMNVISIFGEMIVPVILFCFIHWCIDRRKSFAFITSLMTALVTTQVMKAIVRFPRPYQVYPELIEGGRIETATGYSFPSGHSTTSSALYTSLAIAFKKKWFTAITVLLIILVPISRMYLGVHWPLDVLVGTAIGLFFSVLLTESMLGLYDKEKPFVIFTGIFGAITLIAAVVLTVLLDYSTIDQTAFSDLMASCAMTAGVMSGMLLLRITGCGDEREGSKGKKFVRLVIGFVLFYLVIYLLSYLPFEPYSNAFLSYFIISIYAVFIYPFIASKINLM